jgi:geranylgeranyl diphosphate synthase type II
MLTSEEINEQISQGIENLTLPERPAGLYEPIRYALSSGGKRIRPNLLLHSVQACGGKAVDALNQALALEMFHNFTLVHDDVMDNADVRRGRLTVHRRWSAVTAILSGDAMLTEATRLAAKCNPEKLDDVLKMFNDTATEVYEGQQYDMDFEHRKDVTIDEYLEMIRLKTSVLLACSCKMGAYLGDATAEVQALFYEFGENLGMAFQLRDDWLDTFGDPVFFGKEIGGDIVNEKKTWLLITAMNESSDALDVILGQKLDNQDKVQQVIKVYDSLNLRERCVNEIKKYAERAQQALDKIDMPHLEREYFAQLATTAATRLF